MPQQPSKGEKFIVEDFGGINQVYDDAILSPGQVRWALGLIDTVGQKLRRLGGCLPLASSNVICGKVLGLVQLEFREANPLIVHSSAGHRWIDCEDIVPYSSSSYGAGQFGMIK